MSKNTLISNSFGILKDFPKPTGANDFKMQAILVYALSRIEYVIKCYKEEVGEKCVFTKEEDRLFIENFYLEFSQELKEYVPNFEALENYVEGLKNLKRPPTIVETIAYSQCVPLIRFYNTIIYECDKIIKGNKIWIPDLFAISLIIFWTIEYSKNTSTYYSLLKKYDLQQVLDKYNSIALENKGSINEACIKLMYDAANAVAVKLLAVKANESNNKNNTRSKKRKKNARQR